MTKNDDDAIALGAGAEIHFIAPVLRDGEPVWGFAGTVADYDISLQRLDPKSELWIPTERIFRGERYRLAYSSGLQTDESPGMKRYWYEKEKVEAGFGHPASARDLRIMSIMSLLVGAAILTFMLIMIFQGVVK